VSAWGLKPLEWLARWAPSDAGLPASELEACPLAPPEHEIDAARARMLANPARLRRPVLILAGWHAWPMQTRGLAHALGELVGDPDRVLPVAYPKAGSVEAAAAHAREKLRSRFGAATLRSIDAVGISMGGLVGRVLARPIGEDTDPLPIRRLYTLATPHRGAKLTLRVAPDRAARQMKPGSEWLERLDAALPDSGCELVPYAVLNDTWVGATRAAPPGWAPIWTPGAALFSHFTASAHRAIVTDLALRLRGDAPLSRLGSMPGAD